ncbi:MAG: acyl-CoA dehydrogenase family protein [Bacteroidota bacterium]
MQVQTTVPELTSVPQYASMDNLRFMLFDVHHIEALSQYEHFGHFDRSTIDMTIDSAKQIADKHMFPYFEEMDRFGCQYEDGKVTIHPHMRTIMQEMGQGGWIGSTASFDIGGMQMPAMLYTAGEFIFEAANNSVVGYPGLTSGAARLIYSFGSPELIDTYVPHMFAGKWQGTMALTEPESGSSLSDIVTSAKETAEGHYLIDGQKIFISSGDHDAVDNVVHLMLARSKAHPLAPKAFLFSWSRKCARMRMVIWYPMMLLLPGFSIKWDR